MTTHRASTGPSVALAVGLVVAAAAIVRWRSAVVHAQRVEVTGESWEHIKDDYPPLPEPSEPPAPAAEIFDAILRANPFSPDRLPVSAAEDGEGQGRAVNPAASAPITPQFLYKGHIDLGKRQRAVVEETTAGKTYFLEVGQEVAGFKVLDISQTEVVLSDVKTDQQIVIMRKAEGKSAAGQAEASGLRR
jgi:hypothetical protein